MNKTNNSDKRIIEIREILKLSQQELAKILNVSQTTISRLEKGELPSKKTIIKLEKTFNIDPDWIMTGDGRMFLDGGIEKGSIMQNDIEETKKDNFFDKEKMNEAMEEFQKLDYEKQRKIYYNLMAMIENNK